MRFVGEAIRDYSMIVPGDRIMIGLSGGKDSLILSLALAVLRRRSPVKFGLTACIIDQTGGTMDTSMLGKFMDELDIPLSIFDHPTYSITEERDERSPCSLCANLRRGILAAQAKEAGTNVLALGHHKDDAVETVLLNLFYGGRFKCYDQDRGKGHQAAYLHRGEKDSARSSATRSPGNKRMLPLQRKVKTAVCQKDP